MLEAYFSASMLVAGGLSAEDTPVPISNTVVKLCRADGTAEATWWESTALPAHMLGSSFGVGPSFLCSDQGVGPSSLPLKSGTGLDVGHAH